MAIAAVGNQIEERWQFYLHITITINRTATDLTDLYRLSVWHAPLLAPLCLALRECVFYRIVKARKMWIDGPSFGLAWHSLARFGIGILWQ